MAAESPSSSQYQTSTSVAGLTDWSSPFGAARPAGGQQVGRDRVGAAAAAERGGQRQPEPAELEAGAAVRRRPGCRCRSPGRGRGRRCTEPSRSAVSATSAVPSALDSPTPTPCSSMPTLNAIGSVVVSTSRTCRPSAAWVPQPAGAPKSTSSSRSPSGIACLPVSAETHPAVLGHQLRCAGRRAVRRGRRPPRRGTRRASRTRPAAGARRARRPGSRRRSAPRPRVGPPVHRAWSSTGSGRDERDLHGQRERPADHELLRWSRPASTEKSGARVMTSGPSPAAAGQRQEPRAQPAGGVQRRARSAAPGRSRCRSGRHRADAATSTPVGSTCDARGQHDRRAGGLQRGDRRAPAVGPSEPPAGRRPAGCRRRRAGRGVQRTRPGAGGVERARQTRGPERAGRRRPGRRPVRSAGVTSSNHEPASIAAKPAVCAAKPPPASYRSR